MIKNLHQTQKQSGQAVLEYVLLMAVVVSFYAVLGKFMGSLGLGKKLTDPLRKSFAAAYQYGDPRAKGYEQGSPENHPRAIGGTNDFRLFLNPKVN